MDLVNASTAPCQSWARHRATPNVFQYAPSPGDDPTTLSATSGAASGLGLDTETGRLRAGLSADILVLNTIDYWSED